MRCKLKAGEVYIRKKSPGVHPLGRQTEEKGKNSKSLFPEAYCIRDELDF